MPSCRHRAVPTGPLFSLPFSEVRGSTMIETDWQRRLDDLRNEAHQKLDAAGDAEALEQWRIAYLGRKSALSDVMGGLGKLAPEERRALGAAANEVKRALEQAYAAR